MSFEVCKFLTNERLINTIEKWFRTNRPKKCPKLQFWLSVGRYMGKAEGKRQKEKREKRKDKSKREMAEV